MMRVLVTGSNGFIAKNLLVHLNELRDVEVSVFNRDNSTEDLFEKVKNTDFVFHLAGINRPDSVSEFTEGNVCLTETLCKAIVASGKSIPVVYSSSIHAGSNSEYGKTKLAAEDVLLSCGSENAFPVAVFRLPNVFGKWCRPNYNSMVATFCHNIARGLPITINDASAIVNLVYVDDVVENFLKLINDGVNGQGFQTVQPVYKKSVGEIAALIEQFRESRSSLITEAVGTGFVRALYSTYLSYLPPESFDYSVPRYADERGVFVEMLKTKDSGQFSFFTSLPGVTRGGHYHHSKNEKFMVLTGTASFRFSHLVTNEFHEIITDGNESRIVETVPGWTHDITNVGDDMLVVMLWANEIFDRSNPDTYSCPIDKN